MHKIIGSQCRTARSLLKWNVYDLTNHLGSISSRRIQDFEKGSTQLLGWENEDLMRLFTKNGIEFKSEKVMYKSLAQRRKESDVMRGDAEQVEAQLAEEVAKAAQEAVDKEAVPQDGAENAAEKDKTQAPDKAGKIDE